MEIWLYFLYWLLTLTLMLDSQGRRGLETMKIWLSFLYWLLTLTRGPVTIVFGMKLASLK
jgi:hypothetical protein